MFNKPANYSTHDCHYVAHDSAMYEDANGYFDALALLLDYYQFQPLD